MKESSRILFYFKWPAHDYSAKSNQGQWDLFQSQLNAAQEGLNEWTQLLQGENLMLQAATTIQNELDEFKSLGDQYNQSVVAGMALENKLIESTGSLIAALEKAMEDVIDPAKTSAMEAVASVRQNAVIVLFICALVALICGALISTVISRGICGSLRIGVDFSKAVAKGDLTQKIDLDQKDEIGDLANALNEMASNLNEIIQNIQESASQVASSSEELSSSSQNLANAATEQAASLEETSASIEQLSSSVEQNSSNSSRANEVTLKANKEVEIGGKQL